MHAWRDRPDEPEGAAVLEAYRLANRATLRLARGRTKEALADLDRAVRLAPSDPLVHQNRAEALQGTGCLEKALEDYEAAARLCREGGWPAADSLLARAVLLLRLGDAEEGLRVLGCACRDFFLLAQAAADCDDGVLVLGDFFYGSDHLRALEAGLDRCLLLLSWQGLSSPEVDELCAYIATLLAEGPCGRS